MNIIMYTSLVIPLPSFMTLDQLLQLCASQNKLTASSLYLTKLL